MDRRRSAGWREDPLSERLPAPEEFEELEEPAEAEPSPDSSAGSAGLGPPTAVGGGFSGEGRDFGDRPPFGRRQDPEKIPIEDLNLSMRGYNCLRRSGLLTVSQRAEEGRGRTTGTAKLRRAPLPGTA